MYVTLFALTLFGKCLIFIVATPTINYEIQHIMRGNKSYIICIPVLFVFVLQELLKVVIHIAYCEGT